MVRDIIRFEWLYAPLDLFEERAELQCDRCVFVVDPGRVRASIEIDTTASIADVDRLRVELHEKLNARFLATQLVEHRNYTLSQATTLRESASGQADTLIIIETARVTVQGGAATFSVSEPMEPPSILGAIASIGESNSLNSLRDTAPTLSRFRC